MNIRFLTESCLLKGVLFWLEWHYQLIILRSQFVRYKEEILLYSYLEFFPFLFWVAKRRAVTRRTKLVQGLEGTTCEEQLRTLGLSGLEERRLRGNLFALHSFLRRGRGEGGAELFSLVPSDMRCKNGSKLCQGGSDWTRRSIPLLRWWSNTGIGFLERSLMPQACQCLNGIWTMPLMACFSLVSPELVRQLDWMIIVGPFQLN